MKIILKGELESDLLKIGLKPGTEVDGTISGSVGAVHFTVDGNDCTVWPENYQIVNWRELWNMLGKINVNDYGIINESFYIFDEGTDREEIWRWFESTFNISIAREFRHENANNLREVATIAAVMADHITENLYTIMQKRDCGYITTVETIGQWALDFYMKFKDVKDWDAEVIENPEHWGLSSENYCWDDCIIDFATKKLNEL